MAKALNFQVILDGMETREQHDFLIELDCDDGQGTVFAGLLTCEDLICFSATGSEHCPTVALNF